MSPITEQNKTPEEELKKSSLPDAELKTLVIKMFNERRRRGEEWNENFNKKIRKVKWT